MVYYTEYLEDCDSTLEYAPIDNHYPTMQLSNCDKLFVDDNKINLLSPDFECKYELSVDSGNPCFED